MRITTKTKNLLKKVGIILLCVIVVGLVASTIVGAQDESDYKTVNLSWDVGGINDTGVYDKEIEDSIYTMKRLDCTDIHLVADFNSDISYKVFFYDENDTFLTMVTNEGLELLIENEEFPGNAAGVRIVITPNSDENGEIGLFEKYEYANQLTVKVRTEEADD